MNVNIYDIIIIWSMPLLLLIVMLLIATSLLYILLKFPFQYKFLIDIRTKVEKKGNIGSGWRVKNLFLFLLGIMLLDNGIQASLLYRISHFLVYKKLIILGLIVHAFAKFLTNIDISPYAEIDSGISFYHGEGIVIGKYTTIGKDVTICQGVTTGSGRPIIENGVMIWSGAKILGNVRIGSNSEIGANAVVLRDVPANSIAVGVPAKKIIQKSNQNLY